LFGRIEVLGATSPTEKEARQYDGHTYVERVSIQEHASRTATAVGSVLARFAKCGAARRYEERIEAPETAHRDIAAGVGSRGMETGAAIAHHFGAGVRFARAWGSYGILMSALWRRARAVSVVPRLVVCHDVYALLPAVRLKRQYGCRILYDTHELWPHADLAGQPWQVPLVAWFERRLIRQADVVVTVSPHLARQLQRLYARDNILAVPNAEPFTEREGMSLDGPVGRPLRFLIQGQAAPGRGMDTFLRAWSTVVSGTDAVLYVRCPETQYLIRLKDECRDSVKRGSIVFLPSVPTGDLVHAATFADVGVTPYAGTNPNHVYGCPNKLSQYMHAGLAVLASRQEYVSEVVEKYGCGMTFEPEHAETLRAIVRHLVDRPDEVRRMKRAALDAGRREFNWETQSRPYLGAIRELYDRSGRT
jgi:glycosyltransferase involved in cell wall biosynthesis